MNQTKNYLVTKSVSLIVDYFVVVIVLQVQAVPTHCLVAVVAVVGYSPPSWKYFQWNYSELQPLLLAASEQKKKIIVNKCDSFQHVKRNISHIYLT